MKKTWISKYVDKVVILNLKHRPDRLQESMVEFEKIGIADVVEPVEAIEHDMGIIGCTASHYELVKFAKNAGLKNILIFEDDVNFHDDSKLVEEVIKSAFDTISKENLTPHMLYLGGNATHIHDGHDKSIPYHKQISKNLYQLGGCKTTHAYVIFESLYDTIIEGFENTQWIPSEFRGDMRLNIDFWYLSRIHHNREKFNIYGVYPALAGQRASHSDIENRLMDLNLFEKYNRLLETNGIG